MKWLVWLFSHVHGLSFRLGNLAFPPGKESLAERRCLCMFFLMLQNICQSSGFLDLLAFVYNRFSFLLKMLFKSLPNQGRLYLGCSTVSDVHFGHFIYAQHQGVDSAITCTV